MNSRILEALAVAAEQISEHASFEAADDGDLAKALNVVSDMLHHLSRKASSPLFEQLKEEVALSRGVGTARELSDITLAMAAFLMKYCGHTQRSAAKVAVEECQHSSSSRVRDRLKGAKNSDSVETIADWSLVAPLIESSRTRFHYEGFLFPRSEAVDWRTAVLADLASRARDLHARSGPISAVEWAG